MSGCAIHQAVTPVAQFDEKEVCIIENLSVKAGFLETYKRVLTGKGYAVRGLSEATSLVECPITSTYAANWRWDLALYMAYAEIKVYRNGKPTGEAIYNSLNGGANMGKFINAETKITELVNQLFPSGITH